MTDERFDRDFWDRRWAQVLTEQPDTVASRPPNSHLVAAIEAMTPGLALDAGCGHGAEAIWLAVAGWRVMAVDFAATALEHARSMAQTVGADIAARVEWVEEDLGSWTPPSRHFDLVSCLYVHVAGSVREMVTRLGSGVAPGGSLFIVGHLPRDPRTGEPTPAAGQVQVNVRDVVEALDSRDWSITTAEERTRAAGGGVDAVVCARYQPSSHAGVLQHRPMATPEELAAAYAAAWTERDEHKRRDLLRSCCTAGIRFLQQGSEQEVVGVDELSEVIGGFQSTWPDDVDVRVELTTPVETHHGFGRGGFVWIFGQDRGYGTDFVKLDADGMMKTIVVFGDVGPPPSAA